jgi:hypothetical protein
MRVLLAGSDTIHCVSHPRLAERTETANTTAPGQTVFRETPYGVAADMAGYTGCAFWCAP